MKQALTVRPKESVKSLVIRARARLSHLDLQNFNHYLAIADEKNDAQVLDVIEKFFELVEKK